MVRSILKRLQMIVFILLLITVALGLIYLGYSYHEITRKQYPYSYMIDLIWSRYVDIAKVDDKYYFGDSFDITGDLDLNLSSEDISTKALTDMDSLKLNNKLLNLSNMDINYIVKHDLENKRLYLELNEKIIDKDILNYKYLVDDSTGYYYEGSILDNYINGGNNTYFEMLNDKNTTKSNRSYLYGFIRESLKKNILEDYLMGKDTETNIGDERKKVGMVSLRLDNTRVRDILNGIIKDIKKDKRANLIMTSVYGDFSKYKIGNDKIFLEQDEVYTINIYTSKVLCTPLKVEIVHLDGNDQEVYTYEGDLKEGIFYYSLNNDMKYNAEYYGSKHKSEVYFYDRKNKKIGSIVANYDSSNTLFTMDLDLDGVKYDINYSSKHKDFKSNKSFVIEKKLDFKIVDGLVEKINGNITLNGTIKKNSKVKVDVSEAKLESTLTTEEKSLYDNLRENINAKLELVG